jgi:ABC-type transport system involved in multi-copper enzyme maturation permease subunit
VKARLGIDPLLWKELRGSSRHWRTYGLRVLYVGLIGLAVYNFRNALQAHGPVIGPSEYADLGRELFGAFLGIQIPFIAIAAVTAGADMILKEARAGTLGLLSLAGLSAREIAWGKWKAVLANTGSLILAGTPVLAICYYLGGVGAAEVACAVILSLSAAGVGAAYAVRASAQYSSGLRATLMAFLNLALYALLVTISSMLVVFGAGSRGEASLPIAVGIGAVSAFTVRQILEAAGRLIARREPASPAALPFTDFDALDRYYGPRRHPGLRERLARSGVWEGRPLLWKELVTRPAARMSDGQRAGLLTALGILASGCWLFTEGERPRSFTLVGLAFLLAAATNGAALFVLEREGKKWDVLLSSPTPGWRLVHAKLLGGILGPDSVVALGLFLAAILGFGHPASLASLALAGLAWLSLLAFAYVLGATTSLFSRSLRSAVLLTTGLLAGLLYGLPLLVWFLVPTNLQDELKMVGILEFVRYLNPVELLEACIRRNHSATSLKDPLPLTPLLYYFGGYAGGIGMLLAFLSLRFDRTVGRA